MFPALIFCNDRKPQSIDPLMVLPGWLPWYQFQLRSINRISPLFLADSKLSHEGFEWYFKWPASQAVPDTLAPGFGCFCQSPQPQAPFKCRAETDQAQHSMVCGFSRSEITQKIVVVAGGQWSKLRVTGNSCNITPLRCLCHAGAQRPIGIVGLLGSGDVLGDWSSAEPKPNRWLRLPRTHPRVQKRRADSTEPTNSLWIIYGFYGRLKLQRKH